MLVNGVNKAEGREEGESSNGGLIEYLQDLLCVTCYTEYETLCEQDTN